MGSNRCRDERHCSLGSGHQQGGGENSFRVVSSHQRDCFFGARVGIIRALSEPSWITSFAISATLPGS
jgi:hypothetical protein